MSTVPFTAARSGPAASCSAVRSAVRGPATLPCKSIAPKSGSLATEAINPCAGSATLSRASSEAGSMRPCTV